MEYEIFEADTSTALDAQVTEMLKLGWKLQGGAAVSVSESDDYRYVIFAQAMIKGE